jgi:predicted AlkP superfamily phosphohydrolase/phosphomutase
MIQSGMPKRKLFFLLLAAFTLPLVSYVGPGAGFAFAGSFFFIFAAFFLAIFNFLTFPIRALIRWIKRRHNLKNARFKRVLIVGFDGMDHRLFNTLKKEGRKFPNFDKIAQDGVFSPLWSTEPPISPVAWSTFSTGVNPGKHNIFDFLATDRATYMPKMAGSDILPPKRVWRIGSWEIPLSAPKIELLRKSQSFWKIVSSKGIYSAVLRVPFTFPPEKFYGTMMSGLGTPDLRGTQGSFSFYAEQRPENSDLSEGVFELLEKDGETGFSGRIKGPGHPFHRAHTPLELPFHLTVDPSTGQVKLTIGKETLILEKGRLSPWFRLEFKAGWVTVAGIAQAVLDSVSPLRLYISPLHIDPEKPAMPISHPRIFSVYLAKLLGPHATLGQAEDTWAVNERILSEEAFLQQVYQVQGEREKVFFDTLNKVNQGLIVQVFEATDRVQHMFWKYLPDSHSSSPKLSKAPEVITAIADCYTRMDDFLGRLLPRMKKDDLLMIVSDHGFNAFDRSFHLNSWLHREGYLVLEEGKTVSRKFYADVDWSRSRAYGQGLNGLYINIRDREGQGIVAPGKEAEALKREIRDKLLAIKDEKTGRNAIKAAYLREEIYKGPYTDNAPDVVVGYALGFRVSWESAVNSVGTEIFTDNTHMWCGDHGFTRGDVPGIFFSNHRIGVKDPTLADISPTVLAAFGIRKPAFIDGRDLQIG